MYCKVCQTELVVGSRVCKTCGHPVSTNSTLEDLYFSHLAANAPPAFVEKIRTAPYLEKERRMVTAILFTIANVDEFTEHIPEEKRTSLLNLALDRFAKIIYEYEGTIAKLWENTVLAFFGAPISHEDDPLRAIHAAKSILAENKAISSQIETDFGIPMRLNVVLNTGPILVGDVRSNLKYDFKSLNNTLECLDLAVCSQVPACEVLLFEDTYRFLKPFIECHKVMDIYCEETQSTINLLQLDAITKETNNLVRMPVSHNTPMIGRQKELDLLMDLTETVLAGLGRVGVISGESGIGKSRLILEWKRSLRTLHQPTRLRWIETQGLAFGRELAYHLLKNLLRSALDVSDNAPVEEIKSSLEKTLENLLASNTENIYLYLAHLLEIPLSDSEENLVHQLNALELKAKYLSAIQTFFRNLAHEQPLIIILEDLHWADPSSVDILIDLLTLTSSSPILFCLISRPERDSSGWRLIRSINEKIGTRLTRIEIGNLDEENSQTLVKHLIGMDEIPAKIRQVVLVKSEGNPLFIEELARMLINEGVLVKNEEEWVISPKVDLKRIPDNLQGLLTARIDRLPADARITLRVASVIGRVFSERAIDQIMATYAPDIGLLEQLNTLESIGMIKVAQVNPELTYKFQHILLHDAAYTSIFDEDRGNLHLRVGEVLEELYPDHQERLASQLAHHFMEGKHNQKALFYLDLAGHVAMDSYAHAEAESYFRQAITYAQDDDLLAHLYHDLGETLAQQTKHREAIKAWKNAIRLFKSLNHTDHLARAYARSARSAWFGYDLKHSLDICLEGLKIVEGIPESPDLAYLYQETGRAYFFNDRPEEAKKYCEQALELARRLNAYDVQAEALATIGILPTTKPDDAISALEMAIQISEVNKLYASASRAYINLAGVIDQFGKVSLAREYRLRAVDLADKGLGIPDEAPLNYEIIRDSLWLADFKDAKTWIEHLSQSNRSKSAHLDEKTLDLLFFKGTLLRLQGNFEKAIEIFTDVNERSRQIHDRERTIKANLGLAEVILEPYLINEEKEAIANINLALSMIHDAIKPVKKLPTGLLIYAQCLLSQIYAIQGDFLNAENSLNLALEELSNKPMMEDQIRVLYAQSRLEAARGEIDSALLHLEEGKRSLENSGGRWWHARFSLEMGNHHLKRNEPEDVDPAQSYFRESLGEFKELDVAYYPEAIIEKLRQVKHKSRAQAIAHRIVNQELAEAARVQHTFIPTQSPNVPGYDISGVLLPARETSGDFYDFILLDNGKLGIVIADVGDKGAGAALYMAMSRTLIRTYAGENQLPPDEVIHHVNRRILSDTQRGIFLTVFFGILDPDKHTLTYVNAGHNPPFTLKPKDQKIKISSLEKTGPLVGIFPENKWESKTLKLEQNEILVLYTDGITEAQNKAGEFYDTKRFKDYLVDTHEDHAEKLRNGILENVRSFTGDAPRLDDITLVVIVKKGDQSKD